MKEEAKGQKPKVKSQREGERSEEPREEPPEERLEQLRERRAVQRGIQGVVQLEIQVNIQLTTHVPKQVDTQRMIPLPVLPDAHRSLHRETKPRLRREVPGPSDQFSGGQLAGFLDVRCSHPS